MSPSFPAREQVTVDLSDRSYAIDIASDAWDDIATGVGDALAARGGLSRSPFAAIITDETVGPLHASKVAASFHSAGWRCETITLPPGETTKSLEMVSRCYDGLVEWRADRKTVIVAVGGGVIGDAAGFVAATYVRGLPFVQVPTTLLADVDSSVGGKVGINHPQGKNLIGAFHQPVGVFIDTAALETLPDREYRAGLAEVVKYGVILDADFFRLLEENVDAIHKREPEILRRIIARSCRLKADVVEQDEFETSGLRAILNYGHTFCHAYEALAGYGQLLHGEAVSIGMLDASRLGERVGRVDAGVTARQEQLLTDLGCMTSLPEGVVFDADEVIARMKLDKKTEAGRLRFVLPTRIGHVEVVEGIDEALVREVLAQ